MLRIKDAKSHHKAAVAKMARASKIVRRMEALDTRSEWSLKQEAEYRRIEREYAELTAEIRVEMQSAYSHM